MANEFRHTDVGAVLTEAEYDSVTGHSFDSQATGDILYASSATQPSRLGIGAANTVLIVSSGIPAWSATLTSVTLVTPALGTPASGVLTNCTGLPAASVLAGSFGAGAFVVSTSLQAATVELGHATDTTLSRVSAGVMAVEGNTIALLATTQTFTGAKTFSAGTLDHISAGNIANIIEAQGVDGDVDISFRMPASSANQVIIRFREGSGAGSANNQEYSFSFVGGANDYFRLRSASGGGASTAEDLFRVPINQSSLDANTTWDANVFDEYDDARMLEPYRDGVLNLRARRDDLIRIGVLKQYPDGFIGYNDQRMAALLAGGIYQTRRRQDAQFAELDKRLRAAGI